jgi:uncharacterized protein
LPGACKTRLAELVKIDPKSIGVGQYQHDVNQSELARTLDAVVEDCVNSVGVDLNTASVPLLSRVSGLSGTVAKAVVRWREATAPLPAARPAARSPVWGPRRLSRRRFLRIRGGANPLDMTGVHPETYPVVEQIIAKTGKPVAEIMGRADMLKTLRPSCLPMKNLVSSPSRTFWASWKNRAATRARTSRWRVSTTAWTTSRFEGRHDFGGHGQQRGRLWRFVDLGVHQDGLVHVSQLAHKFVNDAREVVKTGDIVKVQVQRWMWRASASALTMKIGAAPAGRRGLQA